MKSRTHPGTLIEQATARGSDDHHIIDDAIACGCARGPATNILMPRKAHMAGQLKPIGSDTAPFAGSDLILRQDAYGFFGVSYSTSFWNDSQMVS